MSVMEESILKFLEHKAQENDSSSILKPKSFFWDTVIFSLAFTIFGLSISGIIVDFFKSNENSVACYYNSTLQNRDLYSYINSYCHKHLPSDEFFPLLLVAHAATLIAPHHLWKAFFSTEFDSFFSHAARVQILRERNTGQYPIKNYSIVNYLQREFACRKYILAFYLIKLFSQLLLVFFMIAVNLVWFREINDDIMFECSDDGERNQVFGNVTCANPRKLFINILKGTDYALLGLAVLALLFGLVRCFVGFFSTGNYENNAKICYKSSIDPQYYYKPSFISSIHWFQINNDFEFLLVSLHFGLGRVFKTILIEKEISQTSFNDLKELAQTSDSTQTERQNGGVPEKNLGELISDLCKQIIERINLHSDSYTIMDIGSGYRSYIRDIRERCKLKVVSVIFGFHYEGMEEIIESGDRQIGVMLLRIPINLFTLAADSKKAEDSEDSKTTEDPKKKFSERILDFTEEEGQRGKFCFIVVGPMDSQHKCSTVKEIVMNYGEKEDLIVENAVMLIVKPVNVDNIDVSHHFIDWKPGLLRLAIKIYQVIFYTNVIKR